MAWKKGQSGNPSGRPQVVDDFRKKARRAVDQHVLSRWIEEVESLGEHWVRCSELLAAYGYGKPIQPTESKVDVTINDAREMTREQLMAIASGEPEATGTEH